MNSPFLMLTESHGHVAVEAAGEIHTPWSRFIEGEERTCWKEWGHWESFGGISDGKKKKPSSIARKLLSMFYVHVISKNLKYLNTQYMLGCSRHCGLSQTPV